MRRFRAFIWFCLLNFSVTAAAQDTGFAAATTSAKKAELVVQIGHSGTILSLAFSPDGHTLASAGEDYEQNDHRIRLWDTSNGRELRALTGHTERVRSVSFSPNGRTLASGSDDNTIRLWDVASGSQLRTFAKRENEVQSVAFSPDGRTIVSASGAIELWDVATGSLFRTLAKGDFDGQSVAFSPDGKLLASASHSAAAELWDVASGHKLMTLEGAPENNTDSHFVAFSPDGQTLASLSINDSIKIWNVKTGVELRSLHQDRAYSVVFSSDGRMIASAGRGGITLWDAASMRQLWTLDGNASGALAFSPNSHMLATATYANDIKLWSLGSQGSAEDPVTVLSVAFSPDNRQFATAYSDRSITLWDVATGHDLKTFQTDPGIRSIAYSPDGRMLAGSGAFKIQFWDIATGEEVRTLPEGSDTIAFSPDGKKLASGNFSKIKLWDLAGENEPQVLQGDLSVTAVSFSPDGSKLASADVRAIRLWDLSTSKELGNRPTEWVNSVAFSPDGRTLVSAGKRIQLWDVADGHELRNFVEPPDSVLSIAFSPDGRILAGGNTDGTIELWEVATGHQVQTFGEPRESVHAVALSSDGETLVSGTDAVKLWHIATGRQVRTLETTDSPPTEEKAGQPLARRTRQINAVALSPDDRTLASVDKGQVITLSDVASGKELRTLNGVNSEVKLLLFSPDGSTLVSQGFQTELWDVATGHSLRTLPGRNGLTESIAFSPDGKLFAAGGFGTIHLWEVSGEHEPRVLKGGDFDGASIAFTRDGRLLASSGYGIKLWDLAAGSLARTLGEDRNITALAFSPDGNTLASLGQEIKLWNVRDGVEIRKLPAPTGPILSFAIRSDGQILALGKADGTIELWNMTTGVQLSALGTRRESVHSVAYSTDGRTLLAGSGTIKLWDMASGQPGQELMRRNLLEAKLREQPPLIGHAAPIGAIALSLDGRRLAIGISSKKIQLWDLASGKGPRSLAWPASETSLIAFSPDGNVLAGADGSKVQLWDAVSGRELSTLPKQESPVASIAFAPIGQTLAFGEHNIRVWDVATGHDLASLAGHTGKAQGSSTPAQSRITLGPIDKNGQRHLHVDIRTGHGEEFLWDRPASVISMGFSPDGRTLATAGNDRTVKLWDVPSRHELRTLATSSAWTRSVAFSPDGQTLATAGDDLSIRLWDVRTGQALRTLGSRDGHTDRVMTVAFSGDGRMLASGSDDGNILLWDVSSARKIRTLATHAAVLSVAFRPDGRTLVSGDKLSVRFWNTVIGKELLAIYPLDKGTHWLAVNPDGYFDTDNLNQIDGLSWVFPDEPLRALAPEIFMRGYFRPRLMARISNATTMPKVRALNDLNRAQPQVDLLNVEPEGQGGLVSVTVRVASSTSAVQKDQNEKPLESGAYDLRLFRDGQVVAQWPEAGAAAASLPEEPGAELKSWRELHRISLVDGGYTRTFPHIRLPRRSGTDKIEFTAYAFNSDRVKSRTSPYVYTRVTVPEERVPRRAYLITIGVGANQSQNLNLELAVPSAEQARTLLRAKLQAEFKEVVEVPLYSDLEPDSNRVRSTAASKPDFKAVLDLLADRPTDPSLREKVDPKHQLRAAGPDDAVVLYVASHGYADPNGIFYLMPYDTGPNWGVTEDLLTRCQTHRDESTSCGQAQDLLAHSVSSSDLAAWWNGVDAGEMVMILDSCHSGAAAGKEFRPGPLGDPGLGQLSYDKGMQILSASQPAQTEKGEWVTGGEGRTLLIDALETVTKDNPQQTLHQWLHGVEEQLPRTFKQLYPGLKDESVQLPVLLDFAEKSTTMADAPR